MKGNNSRIVKKANTFLVLNCFRSSEPITVEEVARKTSLSRPTVLNIVKELSERNIIWKSGYAESTGGRSPVLLSLNADSYYAVGIDFEFPPIRMAISNMKGEVRHYRKFGLDTSLTKDEILDILFRQLEDFIAESGVRKEKIVGIGLGILGYIDSQQGKSVAIQRIGDWRNVDFQSLIGDRFKLPVYIQNDVHMMALAENNLHLKNKLDNFAYIGVRSARSGIGLALYVNGSFISGNKGNAHLFGHMTVDMHGPKCFCGSHGCLELYVGKKSIIEQYKLAAGIRQPEGGDGAADADRVVELRHILESYNAGEPPARSVLEEVGNILGYGIANIVKLFGVTNIVVGGIDESERLLYIELVRKHVVRNVFKFISDDIRIMPGNLAEEDYPLGSCFLVFEHFFKEPELILEA